MIDREILRGLLKICILSCAAEEDELYGMGLIERMRRCGFAVSPGTLYPNLNVMLREGDLLRQNKTVGGKRRIVYRISKKGREELRQTKGKLKTLDRIFGLTGKRRRRG
ncbi:MAG: PadR family transcriptional regulator [Elusimicrobia bacterium]|nr:PadR family transcriptional regulator [Elusimicrobiota bacterium]MDE2424436.1 PadR family transcriptional regulator [Elusimicrobiota bacterium]